MTDQKILTSDFKSNVKLESLKDISSQSQIKSLKDILEDNFGIDDSQQHYLS
jgi:hypothetical protein